MLAKSTARNLMVFLTDSTDHVTGLTGATLTITLSKDGAAFASISPTVTERGNGWYNIALTTSHTNTVGDLVLRATAASADPIDLREQVVEGLPAANFGALSINASGYVHTSQASNHLTADHLLDRNVSGGSDGGRTVKQALYFLRNKWVVSSGTLTVYDTDDTTSSWTASVSSTPGADPITGNDPA